MKRSSVIMALILSVTAFVANSFAIPITCTFTGDGSGSIAGVAFADSAFTITALGDTVNRISVPGGVFSIDNNSASINILGVGTFNFVTGTRVFVNNTFNTPGFSHAGAGGADLYNGPVNSLFNTWDMLTSIGPVAGSMFLLQWAGGVMTDGGQLVFNDGSPAGTFQAVVGVAAIPETSSTLLLFGCALAALDGLRRKLSR